LRELYEILSQSKLHDETSKALTEEVLQAMLRENTGSHFLDSGGAYGRNWERNQHRDFEQEPEASLSFHTFQPIQVDRDNWWMEFYRSTYHWLRERLTYAPEWNYLFYNMYMPEVDVDDDLSWWELLEGFPKWLEGLGFGVKESSTVNTYNHESLLDQIIQFTEFDVEAPPNWDAFSDTEITALCIHQGCDARGGYTRPVFFYQDYQALYYDQDASIYCNHCHASWDTDDAYHWYSNAYPDRNLDLEEYKKAIPYQEFEQRIHKQVWVWLPWRWFVWANRKHTKTMSAESIAKVGLEFRKKRFGIEWIRRPLTLVDKTFTIPEKLVLWLYREHYHGDPILLIGADHSALCPVCQVGKLRAG
jgi:hypothetical protein